jgi:hypothetical protein
VSRRLRQAEDHFRLWHQKDPRELFEIDYDFPEHVYCVGRADAILYASDKWERDGDFFDYIHDFSSLPYVYACDGAFNLPAHGRKSVKQLLRATDLDGEFALPILAGVRQLVVCPLDEEGPRNARGNPSARKQYLDFEDPPLLCCSPDLKTLVIFSEERGPIFIRGGQMVVTERGIVK